MKLFYFYICFFFLSQTISAQKPLGAIVGSISDDMSGDFIEDAKINLLKGGAHVQYSISDKLGEFRIYNVQEGVYDLVAEAMGFPPLKVSNVPVQALENTELKLSFEGETFNQDTLFIDYKELSTATKKKKCRRKKRKKRKRKTREERRLEKAAKALDDE